jgi:hypothetical protein
VVSGEHKYLLRRHANGLRAHYDSRR